MPGRTRYRRSHQWLSLPDGGLASVDPAIGLALVAAIVERVRPDTILTFGSDGMTGHPDHVAVAKWAHDAATKVMGERCRVLAATKTEAWANAFPDINAAAFATGPPTTAPDALVMEVRLARRVMRLFALGGDRPRRRVR